MDIFRDEPLASVSATPVPSILFPFAVIIPEPFTLIPPVPEKVAGHSLEIVLADPP